MKIIEDGQVEIRNKTIGESKIVGPNELPSYGIPYSTYATDLNAYKGAVKGEGEAEEPRTGADAKIVAAARSGIKSAESAKKELFNGNSLEDKVKVALKMLGATTGELPLELGDITPWGRGLEKDLFNLADSILRVKTGAAAPEKEIRRYLKKFGPRLTDSEKVKEKKVNEMQAELADILSEMGEKEITKEDKDDPLGILK